VLRLSHPAITSSLFWPELSGRLIQDRELSALRLFPLPFLEPAQSDFVSQSSGRQVGKSQRPPEGARCSPPSRLRAASAAGNTVNRSKARANSVAALVSSVRGGARSPVGLAPKARSDSGDVLRRQATRQ